MPASPRSMTRSHFSEDHCPSCSWSSAWMSKTLMMHDSDDAVLPAAVWKNQIQMGATVRRRYSRRRRRGNRLALVFQNCLAYGKIEFRGHMHGPLFGSFENSQPLAKKIPRGAKNAQIRDFY